MTLENQVTIQTDVSEGFAKKVIEKFAAVYNAYSTIIPFPSKRARPFVISIFKEKGDFLRYQKQIAPTKSDVGFYIPDRGELVLVYQGSEQTLRTLYHEAFHAYFEDRIIHPPAWLNEGLAQYVEIHKSGIMDRIVRGTVNQKWDITLAQLYKDHTIPHIRDIIEHDWPDRHALTDEEYALSLSLVTFLKKEHEEAFNNYLQLLYNKEHPQRAFYTIWTDLETLDKEWKDFIKKEIRKRRLLRLLPGT